VASLTAIARPMPRAAPVTSATLPANGAVIMFIPVCGYWPEAPVPLDTVPDIGGPEQAATRILELDDSPRTGRTAPLSGLYASALNVPSRTSKVNVR
jgi:hypothetical protein